MTEQSSSLSLAMRHVTPAFRTYAGDDSLDALERELTRTRAQRVVLMHGRSMARHAGPLALVEAAIGARLAGRFGGVAEHSPVNVVEQAVRVLADVDADAVIVVGGGSAIVTARAAVIMHAETAAVGELATRREGGRLISPRLKAPKIAQWIVPTTPTTAYAKAGAAVRDVASGERLALFDPKARAAGVFLHPALAATAPPALVRGAALNAFAMAVDGLQSSADDPLAEAQLRHVLHLTKEWLPLLISSVGGSVGLRLMLAALLAGQASDYVGAGLAQPISHALGPLSNAGNGVVEAILLPHVMRYNRGTTDEGLVAVAQAMGSGPSSDADIAIRAVEELLRASGVPARLRDVGIDRAALDGALPHIAADWSSTTVPKTADENELRVLLERAW